jgi:two-component system, NarL family, invasion response regulator UvrY
MLPIKIMIVEDHQLVREIWAQMLKEQPGLTVVAATGNGEEAISLSQSLMPDIVLMDISMTPLSGIEITPIIMGLCSGIKIIGLSMHSHPSYARKMLLAGARGYASKNSSREEMMEAIMQVYKGAIYICAEVRDALMIGINDADQKLSIGMLSDRETEIAYMVRDGHSSKEIAEKLNLSARTVEVHRHHILKKLKLRNSAALVQFVTANHPLSQVSTKNHIDHFKS